MPALIRIVAVLLLSAAVWVPTQAATRKDEGEGTLASVMAGEFALQAGQLQEAARWYLQAAEQADDVGLAELATRISLLAEDDTRARRALALWRDRAPASLAMRAAQATLDIRGGNVRAARGQLSALLRDPDPQAWRYALTALGSGGRNPKLSAQLLGELVDDKALPDALPAWLAFGGLAQTLEQPQLAERIVAQVVERFPVDPRVSLLHASQLRRSDKPAEARKVLDGLVPGAALDPEVRLALASEYDALGDPVAAAGAIAQGEQDARTYGLRASLLAKAEDNMALAALYDELRRQPAAEDSDRNLLLGQIAQYLKRPQEALDWYRKVGAGEQQAEASLRAAHTLYDLGRKPEAYAEAARLQGDATLDDDARRNAYLLEAELRQKDEDGAGELDALARGLAAYPDDGAILYARGLAWERRDRIDRAEADLRRILVSEPENTAALNALGYTLADRTARYQEALELIDRARAAEPDEPAIIDSYGWVLYRLGRTDEALTQLRRAFTLFKDPEIAAHIGEVLWVSGQQDEARRYFEEARKLDPENRSLLRALEKTGA